MKELKKIKDTLFKLVAMVICAILVAELAPIPAFNKTVKAADPDSVLSITYDTTNGKFLQKRQGETSWTDASTAWVDFGEISVKTTAIVEFSITNPVAGESYQIEYFNKENNESKTITVDSSSETDFSISDYWSTTLGQHEEDTFVLSINDGLNVTKTNPVKINYIGSYYYEVEFNDSIATYGEPLDYTFSTNNPGSVGLRFVETGDGYVWYDDEPVPLSPILSYYFIDVDLYETQGDNKVVIKSYLTTLTLMDVKKAKGTFTLNKATIHPGDELPVKEVSITYLDEKMDLMELNGYKVLYRPAASLDGLVEFSPTMPTAVGSYVATVKMVNSNSFNANDFDEYYEFEEVPFEIVEKTEGEASVEVSAVYGKDYSPVITSSDYDKSTAVVKYKAADNTTYLSGKPVDAGDYYIEVTFPENEDFLKKVITKKFSIAKAEGSATFSVDDIVYGQELVKTITSKTNDTNNVVIFYTNKNDETEKGTTTEPTEPGEYRATATLPGNSNYEPLTVYDDFVIKKAKGTGSVTVKDITYGQKVTPEITSDIFDISKAIVEYKKSDGSSFSQVAPTMPGKYTVRVTFPENDRYESEVVTSEFTIGKAKGIGTVSVKDIYEGQSLTVTYNSSTNGNSNVKVYYKKKSAADSTYTTTVPVEVGEYDVKVVFPENDYYLEVSAIAEFKILDANVPAYTITGTRGKNGYYTSDVTVKAPYGYEVSTNKNTFSESVVFTETTKGIGLYFKNKNTGVISKRIEIDDILIDKEGPSVKGAADKKTVYADSVEVEIADDNLTSVTLDGVKVNIQDGKALFTLESMGKKKTYEIVATDIAGNESVISVTVAAPWLENKVIPAGEKIILTPGEEYTLPEGSWKVSGDSTVYSGGMKFYVSGDAEVTFNKQ